MVPDDLADDAIVVRGGRSSDSDRLLGQARDAFEQLGIVALSVFVGLRDEADSVAEVVALVAKEAPVPNTELRTTTVGALRACGFRLIKTGRPRHYSVDIGSLDVAAAERFIAAFDEPRRNPYEMA